MLLATGQYEVLYPTNGAIQLENIGELVVYVDDCRMRVREVERSFTESHVTFGSVVMLHCLSSHSGT